MSSQTEVVENVLANEVANIIGSIAYRYQVSTISLCLFYGIFVPIFFRSVNILRRRQHHNRRVFIVIAGIIALSTTALVIFTIGLALRYISFAKEPVHGATPSWNQRLQSSEISAILYSEGQVWCTLINLLIGDSIIAWRAFILWSHFRFVQVLIVILLVGTAVFDLYSAIKIVAIINGIEKGKSPNGVSSSTAGAFFFSFGLNVSSTAFILIRAWRFRQMMKSAFLQAKKSMAYQVFVLLVECGLIFCALQLATALIILQSAIEDPNSDSVSSSALAYFAFTSSTPVLAGIYPLLVIIIVAGKQSMINNPVSATHNSLNSANHTDNERQFTDSHQLSMLEFPHKSASETSNGIQLSDHQSDSIALDLNMSEEREKPSFQAI